MPEPALPIPPAPQPVGLVALNRSYFDLLQRPMSGTVTIRGTATQDSVKVTLVQGRLSVHLPPDEYLLEAALWNVDGATSTRSELVDLISDEE